MALSNTAVPKYYGEFRDAVIRGEIPVCKEIEMEMNRIDDLIADPDVYYDDQAVEGFIKYCENELTLTDGSDLKLLDSFKVWAEQIFGWYEFEENRVYVPYEDGYGGRYVTKIKRKRLIKDRIVRHVLCDELLIPKIRRKIIYDNCASLKGRGISMQRKRFEVHLRKYYKLYGNEGYILFGDFSKFYDNIIHEIAKKELLELFEDDEFIDWLLNVIFDGFKVDVSYMSDDEYASCLDEVFNKLEYRKIPKNKLTGEKFMEKSVNMGDQLSQAIGIYYPHRIDNYVKYVRGIKFYGRYSDDWYIMSPSKEELLDLLENIKRIAHEYGIHINMKKTKIVKISGTYKFLQIKYTLTESGKIMKRINPDRIYTMRRKLKKLAVKVENGEIPYENVEGMFKGWMGDFYKLMSRTQRKDLLELYEGLFNKTITIVKKKMIIKDRSQQESTWEVA